ncbi:MULTISPECIES: hypothetical protein [Oceanobacillus]|uniref:hypothetical protein n=1 Tax=Oceanobacillus TaxID=182709 RepID=UPI001314C454|nr:hypothetical protein [Oceanobacillus profundus]
MLQLEQFNYQIIRVEDIERAIRRYTKNSNHKLVLYNPKQSAILTINGLDFLKLELI